MKFLIITLICLMIPLIAIYGQTVKPRIIILLGPPASGKGTQAVQLANSYNIPHISTGDLFRENIGKNTELGKKAKSYMDKGQLVPDDLVLDMLFDRVQKPDASKGYVLDGFPRTIPQAEAFQKKLKGNEKVIVLNLVVQDDTLIKRTSGRVTCKTCGNIQNIYFNPPQTSGKCDKCGGELVTRPDDRREVVEERLKVYHNQTEPLIGFYKDQGLLKDIDGEQKPEEVFNQLKKAIEE